MINYGFTVYSIYMLWRDPAGASTVPARSQMGASAWARGGRRVGLRLPPCQLGLPAGARVGLRWRGGAVYRLQYRVCAQPRTGNPPDVRQYDRHADGSRPARCCSMRHALFAVPASAPAPAPRRPEGAATVHLKTR